MNSPFTKKLEFLQQVQVLNSLSKITRGIEKECLRVDQTGIIASTSHPKALGSNLTHPFITTDYSEALLEFITPPLQDVHLMFHVLTELHQYAYRHLENEYLWAGSMPCQLPKDGEIPVAQYGSSNLGRLKYIYRLGLGHRYGRRMQTISGVHYNFSFPQAFWEQYAVNQQFQGELRDFISERYLGLIRNAFRFSWLLPFFFGASPAVCASFLGRIDPSFQMLGNHTCYLPYATSLRLSDLGYHNKSKPLVTISYNSFAEFLASMHLAVHTPDPNFAKIGVKDKGNYRQLSSACLQVEDEHYALFRPKRIAAPQERMLAALNREGIEYIEVRALDIDPFLPLGIELETVYFLDIFLMFCLFLESPDLSEREQTRLQENMMKVVTQGRDPNLTLRDEGGAERLLTDWAAQLLLQMQEIAEILDGYALKNKLPAVYSKAIQNKQGNLKQPSQLPSARILSELLKNNRSFFDFMVKKSQEHKAYFEHLPWTEKQSKDYLDLAQRSLQEAEAIKDTLSFDEFLKNFLIA